MRYRLDVGQDSSEAAEIMVYSGSQSTMDTAIAELSSEIDVYRNGVAGRQASN
jgi:hypothetical protein